jgi:hypothetical protein
MGFQVPRRHTVGGAASIDALLRNCGIASAARPLTADARSIFAVPTCPVQVQCSIERTDGCGAASPILVCRPRERSAPLKEKGVAGFSKRMVLLPDEEGAHGLGIRTARRQGAGGEAHQGAIERHRQKGRTPTQKAYGRSRPDNPSSKLISRQGRILPPASPRCILAELERLTRCPKRRRTRKVWITCLLVF